MIYDFIKGSDVAKSTLLHIITGLSFSWLGELINNGSGKEDVKQAKGGSKFSTGIVPWN